jgi:hypothetical protein
MPEVLFPSGDVISLAVLINGKAMPNEIEVHSVYCETGFNLIPMLQLGLRGPVDPMGISMAPWLDQLNLKGGSQIEVKAGYEGALTTIFKGNFMGLTMGLDDDLEVLVEVDAISPVFKLDLEMDIHHFENITTKELLVKLTKEQGFSLQEDIEADSPDDIYFEGTAWELLLEIANENERVVLVNNDSIEIVQSKEGVGPVGTLEAGNNVLDFELTMDAFLPGEKDLFGEIAIPGTTEVGLNDIVQINGAGNLFDGDALVVSITHDLAEGQWETMLGVSMG